MYKRSLLIITTLLICLSLVFALGGCGKKDPGNATGNQGAADGDFHMVINLADHLTPEHPYMKYASVIFMNEVTERTNGRIEFKHYHSTQAGEMKDQINMMQTGIVHMANSPAAVFSEQMPLSNVANLPGWGLSTQDLALAFYDVATDEDSIIYKNDFEKNKMKMLFCGNFPMYQVQSNKPVTNVNDLKSLIVRSPGGVFEFILQALGTSVITLPPTEIYEAMQRGTIDAMYSPQESLIPQALNEVMKYSTGNLDLNSFIMMWDISLDTWNKLPADIQEIMVQVGREVTETFSTKLYEVYDEAQKELEDQGIIFNDIADDQLALMHDLVSVVPETWVKAMDDKGLAGTQAYEEFAAAVEKYKN